MKRIFLPVILIFLCAAFVNAQKAIDFYNSGVKKVDSRDFEGAKNDFQKAIEIDPNYAFAHNNLALLLIKQFGDKESAKFHYEKAIELDPKNANTHFNYAFLLRDYFNDKQGAKLQFEKALAINPYFAEGQLNYALILRDLGNKELAKKHYISATKLNQKLINANLDMEFDIIR
jgi:Tfp pilus assembly protein PilF